MLQSDFRLSRLGQTHHKSRAVAHFAFDLDPSAMEIRNTMDLSQSQPGTFFFGRKKWKKNLVEIVFGDSFSAILKADFDDIGSTTADFDAPQSCGNCQSSPFGHGIEGIDGQIPKHLFQLIVINLRGQTA